jgi:uncharacterized protein DUF2330
MTARARFALAALAVSLASALTAGPALACAGLVSPGGNVKLLRTATLAAWTEGVEHYITSFEFAGGGAEFGSIVPLPAVPSKVERGGDWTLQRLERETQPQPVAARSAAPGAAESDSAEEVYNTRIDALDITILKGGGAAVGKWAKDHGFALTPDAPEVLDFYAARSPVFMAARFDAQAARERDQEVGDGTPIHLTIPLEAPWVPLRVLALGRDAAEQINADVYLLTPARPNLLPEPGDGLVRAYDQQASKPLLDDLRSDKGMEWVPERMWLTYLRVAEQAEALRYDLAIHPTGTGAPSRVAAGLEPPPPTPESTTTTAAPPATSTTKPKPPVTTPPTVAAPAPPAPLRAPSGPTQPEIQPDLALPPALPARDSRPPAGLGVLVVAAILGGGLAAGAATLLLRRVTR